MANDQRQGRLRHVPKRLLCNDFYVSRKLREWKENRAIEHGLSSIAKMILLTAIERNRPAGRDGSPDPSVQIQVIDLIELRDFIESNPFWRSEIGRIKGCGRATLLEIERYASANGINTGVSALDREALESAGRMGLGTRALNAIRILTNTDVPTFQTLYDLVRENPDWSFDAFCLPNCGWKTMKDIMRFADSYGLLPKTQGKTPYPTEREFFEEIKRRKADGSLFPEKKYPYARAQKENRSEPPPTNI